MKNLNIYDKIIDLSNNRSVASGTTITSSTDICCNNITANGNLSINGSIQTNSYLHVSSYLRIGEIENPPGLPDNTVVSLSSPEYLPELKENAEGLEFYTNNLKRMEIQNTGDIYISKDLFVKNLNIYDKIIDLSNNSSSSSSSSGNTLSYLRIGQLENPPGLPDGTEVSLSSTEYLPELKNNAGGLEFYTNNSKHMEIKENGDVYVTDDLFVKNLNIYDKIVDLSNNIAGSSLSAIRLILKSNNQTNLTSTYRGIEFDPAPTFEEGNNWTVTEDNTYGTYIKTSKEINAFISYGFTIDDNGNNSDNVCVKLQTSPDATTWTDVTGSKITTGSPSATPNYYGNSGTCIVKLVENTYIRAVVNSTNTGIDLEHTLNGNTYISIHDLIGGGGGSSGAPPSDIRLKNNIKLIENPLEKLEMINGYTFDWIENSSHSNRGPDIGVIAQEVEQVLPEVTTTNSNGYKGVYYEKIIPFLISCIKEQQKQINELKELVNN